MLSWLELILFYSKPYRQGYMAAKRWQKPERYPPNQAFMDRLTWDEGYRDCARHRRHAAQ